MNLLSTYMHGACQVVKVQAARLDASLVPEFKRAFSEAVPAMPDNLALDMSEIRFVDSTALGALVALYKQAQGVRLRLVGVTPPVLGLLKLTRMDRVFEVVDTLQPVSA